MSADGPKAEEGIGKAFEPQVSSLRGLRNTVLVRLLVVALIPLIALSWYFRRQFTTTLEERSLMLLETIARGHQNSIDQIIESKINALSSLADNRAFPLPPSKTEINSMLNILRKLDETILDIGVFDSEGNHVRYAGPFGSLEGKSYKDEPWFQALSTSRPAVFVSDVYMGYRDQPHFIIAVRSFSGGQSWYLRITIDPVRFNRIVSDIQVVEGAQAFIVNREGVFQSVADDVGVVLTRAPDLPGTVNGTMAPEAKGEPGNYLVAYSKLRSIDWTLVVRQDLSVANKPIYNTSRGVLLIIFIGVTFIVMMSIYATQTLVRRYRRSERDRAKLIEHLFQAGKISTLGEMAAGVAHEINNPLATVLSEVGVMKDFLDPSLEGEFNREDFLEKIDSIEEEVYRCRDITHKLLGFARRSEPMISRHDLNALIEETIELINKELSLENIEIVLELDQGIPEIMTDGEKIKQVLLNLLRNSADAIGKDGRIIISTHDDKEYVATIVTDTGCGIPKEDMSRLFLPFFTTKDVGRGTGLGLSISHGIITSLGGKINATSKVGQGTSFEILLPKGQNLPQRHKEHKVNELNVSRNWNNGVVE